MLTILVIAAALSPLILRLIAPLWDATGVDSTPGPFDWATTGDLP